MILKENYTYEHINDVKKYSKADPSIIERTIFAFGLLEAIKYVGMPFIFKGGTSLLLLLDEPKRLSTDIDIIVEPNTDIKEYIEQAGKVFPFVKVKEDVRTSINSIKKQHFVFTFLSPILNHEINILLDVVFEQNPYSKTLLKPIKNKLILTEGEDLMINVPNINELLGDKMVAFAPHTTGILFNMNKDLEIIKQAYDCYTLFDKADDFSLIRSTYLRVAEKETKYRNANYSIDDILLDTINACLSIIGRGGIRKEEYKYFLTGINAIQGHLITERMNGENAAIMSCRILYLASCLLLDYQPSKIIDNEQYKNLLLNLEGAKRISYIKKVDLLAYAYLIESFKLLNKKGLFVNSVFDCDK